MFKTDIEITPLDAWISQKIVNVGHTLSKERIEEYQLVKLRETIARARSASPFYRNLFQGIESNIRTLDDLKRFPFTTAENIKEHSLRFLCVSQDDINRVVTLDTSGTTANPKRLYFTSSDVELTVDFFQHGMSTLAGSGDRVLILLPGERPGSVGDLLAVALKRLGATPVPHGIVRNMPETLKIMARENINSIVGIPVQVLSLAGYADAADIRIGLKSVLLSTDNVPATIVSELKRLWDCRVFEHYGMTEMGLGGGVECAAHDGYHLREADLYFEIIDERGSPVADGQQGEIVFTTLNRQGMPLIRYRTGDVSRIIPGPCRCGSIIRRLQKIAGRVNGQVEIGDMRLGMPDLDEQLFGVPGIIDFSASVDSAQNTGRLVIRALTVGKTGQHSAAYLLAALDRIQAIYDARTRNALKIDVRTVKCNGSLPPYAGKRLISVLH